MRHQGAGRREREPERTRAGQGHQQGTFFESRPSRGWPEQDWRSRGSGSVWHKTHIVITGTYACVKTDRLKQLILQLPEESCGRAITLQAPHERPGDGASPDRSRKPIAALLGRAPAKLEQHRASIGFRSCRWCRPGDGPARRAVAGQALMAGPCCHQRGPIQRSSASLGDQRAGRRAARKTAAAFEGAPKQNRFSTPANRSSGLHPADKLPERGQWTLAISGPKPGPTQRVD